MRTQKALKGEILKLLTTAAAVVGFCALSGCALLPGGDEDAESGLTPAQKTSVLRQAAKAKREAALAAALDSSQAVPVEVVDDLALIGKSRQLSTSVPKTTAVASKEPTRVKSKKLSDLLRALAEYDSDGEVVESLSTPHQTPPSPALPPTKAKRRTPASLNKDAKRRLTSVDGSYSVKPGDTLMKIAFQKFGSVYRWREIYEENKNRIKDFNALEPGTMLMIKGVEYVIIQKNGEPYLIRRGDTLVGISGQVYGTPKYWKELWHNNPQLIRDPNKIYAGFTLYYAPIKDSPKRLRSPASKKK